MSRVEAGLGGEGTPLGPRRRERWVLLLAGIVAVFVFLAGWEVGLAINPPEIPYVSCM